MNCPVCLSSNTTVFGSNLSFCAGCNHAFQSDLLVTADYGGAYASTTYDNYPTDTSFLRAGYVLGRTTLCRGNVLDVGYGNGFFLSVMKKCGFSVYGIDVHNRQDGVERGSVDRHYDIVTFFDSLEHIPDLSLPINAEHCVISLPHRPFWFLVSPEKWRHYKPGEHLHYFSSDSLCHLMRKKGFLLQHAVILEDSVRTPQKDAVPNIMTYHFKKDPHAGRV